MEKHYRKENNCLNCGATLKGKFCHVCGQENLEIKESFGHMMNHAISDYFHFDHQFFHTLKPLCFKPGFLTNEYMAGRRVQYLHPVKMYIFISLVYFVVLFQTGHQLLNTHVNYSSNQTAQMAIDSIVKNPEIPANVKRVLIDKLEKNGTTAKNNSLKVTDDKDTVNKYFLSPTSHDSTYAAYLSAQQNLPPNQRDGVITKYYNEKAYGYRAKYGDRTKDVLIEEFQHNVPKMMFFLLPFCALVLMVTFKSNRKYYVEHLIYSFHLHCFIFLFLAIIMLLQWIIPVDSINGLLGFAAFLVIIWYTYQSLKVVYGRSAFRTITKMIGASFMYLLGFTICITLAFIVTALIAA